MQDNQGLLNSEECLYNVDPVKAADARWDEASKRTIKVSTKPCPKCRTPTERDGKNPFLLLIYALKVKNVLFFNVLIVVYRWLYAYGMYQSRM